MSNYPSSQTVQASWNSGNFNVSKITCQEKSEDKIGNFLEQVIDGFLDPNATVAAYEAAGKALMELARSKVHSLHPTLRSEREDIQSDAVAGTLKALIAMQEKGPDLQPGLSNRKELKSYIYGIIDTQVKSGLRRAQKYAFHQHKNALEKLEIGDEGKERTVDLGDVKALEDHQARLRRHAPTVEEVQTAIEKAALRGELFGAALYAHLQEFCAESERPMPKMPAAPKGMSKRTRQRREQEGNKRIADLFSSHEPGM